MECDQTVGPNHTHKLFEQLADITHAFNACNLKHVVLEGTLIGALRDHAMNKHEVQKITRVCHNIKPTHVTIPSLIPCSIWTLCGDTTWKPPDITTTAPIYI